MGNGSCILEQLRCNRHFRIVLSDKLLMKEYAKNGEWELHIRAITLSPTFYDSYIRRTIDECVCKKCENGNSILLQLNCHRNSGIVISEDLWMKVYAKKGEWELHIRAITLSPTFWDSYIRRTIDERVC